jgi:hypothetical protein
MKKKLCALLVTLGLLVPTMALPATAGAVNVFQACGQGAGASDVCKEQGANAHGSNPFLHAIKVVLDILTIIVGIAAVIMLIFSGLKMIWAQGDTQAIKSARDGIIGAAVGIAVAALAQAMVVFVLNKIG